jgi:hypothetical protein
MSDTRNIPLVSSQIAGLWRTALRVNVQDNEIRTLMQYSMDASVNHIPIITNIFKQEGLPIPNGYTEQDVNLNAPQTHSAAYIDYKL